LMGHAPAKTILSEGDLAMEGWTAANSRRRNSREGRRV